ncbi:hypothetical protein K9M47_00795 [Candidatus Gracilibacteria bacterium]|nr:hypothetical protein [Candidatus Gracilibacteria bacterium]MCF7898331.1 hypothetical protein [Candidatus Paceibacterota bacterium]
MSIINSTFARRLMICFGFKQLTKDELERTFDRIYPVPRVPLSPSDIKRYIRRKNHQIDYLLMQKIHLFRYVKKGTVFMKLVTSQIEK